MATTNPPQLQIVTQQQRLMVYDTKTIECLNAEILTTETPVESAIYRLKSD